MNTYEWYAKLIKPSWAPPSWVFGPVWTVLYLLIAVSFGTIFYKVYTRQLPWMVALPFVLNLVFNFAFSPIQFKLKNNILTSIDVFLVVATLIWALLSLWRASSDLRWIVYLNIPYTLWGTFATCLQFTITYLNWGKK